MVKNRKFRFRVEMVIFGSEKAKSGYVGRKLLGVVQVKAVSSRRGRPEGKIEEQEKKGCQF